MNHALPEPVRVTQSIRTSADSGETFRASRAQLLYARTGTPKVATREMSWVLTQQTAVWIPPSQPYRVMATGEVTLQCLSIREDAVPEGAPRRAGVLPCSPLLRELLDRACQIPEIDNPRGREAKLIELLMSELDWTPAYTFVIPTLRDGRLRAVERALIAHPADRRTIEGWASTVGTSSRTLARLFVNETRMSFGLWRDHLRVAAAISQLENGVQITSLASDLGYETPGGFSAMFKRVTGITPSQYVAGRLAK